jgi:hypothetical protein
MNKPQNCIGLRVFTCRADAVSSVDFDDYDTARAFAHRRRTETLVQWIEIMVIDKFEGLLSLDFWVPN